MAPKRTLLKILAKINCIVDALGFLSPEKFSLCFLQNKQTNKPLL